MAIKHDQPDQPGADAKQGADSGKAKDAPRHQASGGTAGSTPAAGESKSGILKDEP